MEYEEPKAPSFKVIMLGNSTVGKTTILTQLSTGSFDQEPKPTVGGSYIENSIETSKGPVMLQLWDTAGQEQYRCLVPIYSRGASAAIIVFDVSNPDSFRTADEWFDLVNRNKSSECMLFTVANKMDLEVELNLDTVDEWSKNHQAKFFKTSAKQPSSISFLFQAVAEAILSNSQIITNAHINLPPTDKLTHKCC